MPYTYSDLEKALTDQQTNTTSNINYLNNEVKTLKDKLRERREYQQAVVNGGSAQFAAGLNNVNGPALDPTKLGPIYNNMVAASMEKLSPYEKQVADTEKLLADAKSSTTGFDQIAKLLGLKQEEDKMKLDAASKGLVVDSKTGEISQTAGSSELVDAYTKQILEDPKFKLSSIPDDNVRNAVVLKLKQQGMTPEAAGKVAEKKRVTNIFDELKTLYDGSDTTGSLAQGLAGGNILKIQALTKQGQDNKDSLPARAQVYMQTRDALLGTIKGLVGESGVMTDQDALRLKNMLPDPTDTPTVATMKWDQVNNYLNSKFTSIQDANKSVNVETLDEADLSLIEKYKTKGK